MFGGTATRLGDFALLVIHAAGEWVLGYHDCEGARLNYDVACGGCADMIPLWYEDGARMTLAWIEGGPKHR